MKHLLIERAGQLPRLEHLRRDEEAGQPDDGDTRNGPVPWNTGHSVHFERPRFLAREIVNFLPWEETPKQVPTEVLSLEITSIYREVLIYRRRPRYGRITAVMGTNHTKNEPFSLMVPECVDFIDFGCDVFVTRADGGRTPVHVVRRRGARPYIAANPDESGENNLLALGD